jgi:hypothetical protein
MWTTSNVRRGQVLAGIVLLSACSESTAPNASRFDGVRVSAGVAVVEKVAASSALSSVQLLARFGGDVGASSTRVSTPELSPGLAEATRVITESAVNAGTALVPVIRPSVLGKTFVFDPAQRKYVVDPARTGAPANGVRFILYEGNSSGEPIVSNEIGYADLTDDQRSTPNVAAVTLVAVTNGITQLSYSFALTLPGAAPSISVHGYLVDGGDRLDFTVSAGSTMLVGGKATVQATLIAPKQGFQVSAKMSGVPGEQLGDGNIDLTVTSASDKIVIAASVVSQKLDATFTVNGNLLAHATGDPRNPVITGQGGRPLTADELEALGRVVEMSDAIFKLVCDLVEPAGKLLWFAIGLGS